MKARLLHHGCYSILPHRAPITSLVTLPLRGLHKDGLHGLLVLLGELASELGKGLLVMGHADRQALEVRELGGQTNGVRVDEHPVAGLATDAVHLEDTALLHVTLNLGEEVLAETNRPAGLHLVEELDVLIHKPVDLVDRVGNLDVLGGEDEGDLAGTGTHVLADLDVSAGAHSLEEITDGSEATALALGDVVGDLVRSSGGVRL